MTFNVCDIDRVSLIRDPDLVLAYFSNTFNIFTDKLN